MRFYFPSRRMREGTVADAERFLNRAFGIISLPRCRERQRLVTLWVYTHILPVINRYLQFKC